VGNDRDVADTRRSLCLSIALSLLQIFQQGFNSTHQQHCEKLGLDWARLGANLHDRLMIYSLSPHRPSFESLLAEIPGISTPTPEQLERINIHAPRGVQYTAEELVMVPILASHNLMAHSNLVWSINALEDMARKFPGRPIELNHDWMDVQQCVGTIFDAFVLRSADAPDEIVNANDNGDSNRQILARDGFAFLIQYAAFPNTSGSLAAIKANLARDVSTGVFTDGEMYCPHCQTSFSNPDCPHWPPLPILVWYFGDDPDVEFADYYIYDRVMDAVETSLVVSGDVPGAEVLR
jgi:hypothetical protein